MAQVTLRTDDELVQRVRDAARVAGRSMNEYIAFVLDVATNADLAGSDVERVRERLRRADLLIPPEEWPRTRRAPVDRELLRQAGDRAAKGVPVADLVREGR